MKNNKNNYYYKYTHNEVDRTINNYNQSTTNSGVTSYPIKLKEQSNTVTDCDKKYSKKSVITHYEKYFYDIFEKNFGNDYKIQTQINLASVVEKNYQNKYRNELFKNIDFGIFDKETLETLLLIEINDKTHKSKERYDRDLKVREILNQSGIKLLTFYSSYPNKEEYIVKRVKEELEKNGI